MAKKKESPLSAQVLLRSARGEAAAGDAVITAETLERYLPSTEAAERVRQRLSLAGFEAGPLVGNSFSITAPAKTFEKVFGTGVREAASEGRELDDLPGSLAKDVAAVTFTPPPDFGPTSY
ncbi:MAG TPA: hypothetical protein VE078_15815 [Thermoanaerobaculia bacterium]|nr:hypothetical protein [Thermoanaerobaculia bacterium]